MKYGLKITIWREEHPGITMELDMPEVGQDAFEENPALGALQKAFDKYFPEDELEPAE